jgi:hypothetical protein
MQPESHPASPPPSPPPEPPEQQEQRALLRALAGTVQHFFGGWTTLFGGVIDPRNPVQITYPLAQELTAGTLLFLFRLGSRRAYNEQLRHNGPSAAKFAAWFGVEGVAHGDTLNYAFQRVQVAEVQEVLCGMVARLIRQKVLYRYRLLGVYYLVSIDGTGVLTFPERHCAHCLTRTLTNGATLYYHPVLEAKLVTANGFAFSLLTEFIENAELTADKQDCELKAFYRLAKRLKARFPHLPICLLLDGLYAGGPTFQVCEDYAWKYLITLRDEDLPNVHRSFAAALSHLPENHKSVTLGPQAAITQTYRWVADIAYQDSADRTHTLGVLECLETRPEARTPTGRDTTKWLWLTNFTLTTYNVDRLANQGGRVRWKIENEGFNVQKNGGFNLEHAYSQDENAAQVFYFLLQIAYLLFQLLEKGSLFRQAFPKGVGALKTLAFRLLETWRNLRLTAAEFVSLYGGRYQIRFDTT